MKPSSYVWIAAAALLAIVSRTSVAGQTTSSNQDTLSALLVEVRGLRAAMEQMASAGPRVQLAFGRLQMQEQRINTLVRRAEELRTQIAEAEGAVGNARSRLDAVQSDLEASTDPGKRRDMEAMVAEMKRVLAQSTRNLQRLQTEEADVSSQVMTEQSRWTDINQRLEELERALAR